MKIESPIEIDLLEFFRSGKFDCLKLGQNKDWVLRNFPDPDSGWDTDLQSGGFDIWTYGNIELHFEKDKLFLIFSDDLSDLNGGKDLRLTRWIFDDPSTRSLSAVLNKLNKEKVDYRKQSDALGVVLRLASGIELTFENTDDAEDLSPNDYSMTSFGLVAENFRRWRI
ncbi:MAG: hypothetical protein R3B94_09300 [Hyphomonas sp.]